MLFDIFTLLKKKVETFKENILVCDHKLSSLPMLWKIK